MTKRKIFNFIIFIPFVLSLGAFILYFKYMSEIKAVGALKVTELMTTSLVRYRNIGVFCLAIGVFLLFIKTILSYFTIDNNYSVREERVLDKISSKQEFEEKKYTFDESNIINDLLNGQTLIANFYNGNKIEKLVKFKNYNKENNTIEFFDLTKENETINEPVKKEYIVQKEESYDGRYFKKCHKCNNVIAKDAPMCVHCGTILIKEEKKETKSIFSPVIFVINIIIILLCIILFLLCFNAISKQSKINRGYFNINTIQKNINK